MISLKNIKEQVMELVTIEDTNISLLHPGLIILILTVSQLIEITNIVLGIIMPLMPKK